MRCLIVDDSATFRDAARRELERGGIRVVAVAWDSAEAMRCYENLHPDVTLVDIDLGSENGIELAERLHRIGGGDPSPVILMSSHAEADFSELIAASSAVGFLPKMTLSPDAIMDLVLPERLAAD